MQKEKHRKGTLDPVKQSVPQITSDLSHIGDLFPYRFHEGILSPFSKLSIAD
jgi:hypothetical protein